MSQIHSSLSLEPKDVLRSESAVCKLFDHVEDVLFWTKDTNGRFTWANVALLIEFGMRRREEIIGKTDYDIHPRHIASLVLEDDASVLEGNEILHRIELLGRFDHEARWFVTCKLPRRDANNLIVGTTGITRPLKADSEYWLELPLGRVIGHMSQNYKEPLDNNQLARTAGMSERTFERQFKQHYGISPHQFLKRLRVRMSCRSLVYSDAPISVIALDHGFSDQSHFTHEFREQIGNTPSEYRKSFRSRAS